MSPTPSSQTSAGGSPRALAALLVEDNLLVAQALSAYLESSGIVTRCSESAELAWDVFDAAPEGTFDVVVCDLTLPGMSGRELIRRMLTKQPTLPIVIVTGFSFNDRDEDLLDLGAASVMPKPVSGPDLIAEVRRVTAI
jgi:CheY-like chemotaxis protein